VADNGDAGFGGRPHHEVSLLRVAAHRLLVSLTQDRCLARLGPGVRFVALISAAHASVCGSLMVCEDRTPL
jgi:hypothetical protein